MTFLDLRLTGKQKRIRVTECVHCTWWSPVTRKPRGMHVTFHVSTCHNCMTPMNVSDQGTKLFSIDEIERLNKC